MQVSGPGRGRDDGRDGRGEGRGEGRVVASHGIAHRALRMAGMFAAVAAVWAVVVLVRGGSWWGPLHAFLAGTVLLAISGLSQMFTITWAAATPPSAALSTGQRWLVATGTAMVLVGVTASVRPVVWIGALGVVAGLAGLGVSITGAVRRSLLRRFDLSARFYLLALACGVVGVTLGAMLGSGAAEHAFARLRLVHAHLNLVGLVGLTIVGTIPTFLPTVAHHRAVSGREAVVAWWASVTAATAFVAGLVLPPWVVGAGSLLAALAGALVLAGVLLRLWEKGRGRPAFLIVSAGVVWLLAWAVADGVSLLGGRPLPPFSGWTAAAVVAGVGQVMAGSLAYLLPVLAGPPLKANLATMNRRAWVPATAVNLAGVALVAGWEGVAAGATGIWILDLIRRLAALARPRDRDR